MGVNRLKGSPWHLEYAYARREENEPRRHKKRCKYYLNNNECAYEGQYLCCGSSRCDVYVEKGPRPTNTKERQRYEVRLLKEEKKLAPGSIIKVREGHNNEVVYFHIVNKKDEDFIKNKICANSPLALAVAEAEIGDTIQVNDHAKYKVLEIIK